MQTSCIRLSSGTSVGPGGTPRERHFALRTTHLSLTLNYRQKRGFLQTARAGRRIDGDRLHAGS